MTKKAFVLFEDGSVHQGRALGFDIETFGEVVFNTAMTGYQEVLTDPSYCQQMVVMTYPHIGSYGIHQSHSESDKPHLSAMIMGDYVDHYSHKNACSSLNAFLIQHQIPAIDQVDTRLMTQKVRTLGAMKAVITRDETQIDSLKKRLHTMPSMEGKNLVSHVTCKQSYYWQTDHADKTCDLEGAPCVVVIDCGVKQHILRSLVSMGLQVEVVPAETCAEDILSRKPDGIMISNGPGDPEAVTKVIETLKLLMGKVPMMGICLGHQLLALALGGKTYKLKFGHHGTNHPVQNIESKKIEITSMNHGFAVDRASLESSNAFGPVEISHLHLSDGTVEGFRLKQAPVIGIQYHPEGAPGPHDAHYLFKEFAQCIKRFMKTS